MPLVNMLASIINNPAHVLEISDTSDVMAAGGKKDTEKIANMFLEHINRVDPAKNLSDVIYFDGASNVQKAGEIISLYFP